MRIILNRPGVTLTTNSIPKSRVAAVALAIALAACNTDDVTAPPLTAGAFTVNASTGWVYVSLIDSAVVTPSPSPAASADWDIAFNATNVMLNGGAAGPGSVTGFCLCQNESATDNQVLAMTAESELPDYEGITSEPASPAYVAEALTPAIREWFTGTAPTIAVAAKQYVVRLSDGTSFAKLRFTNIANATASHAGQVTIQFAVQPTGTTTFGTSQQLTVDLSTGAKNIDLNTGLVTTNTTDWDIRLDGLVVKVNGGASGSGSGGAFSSTTAYDAIAGATAPPIAYSGDLYAGVFGAHPWFRYNILGDNRVSPVFDVYFIKRGTIVWKLQITNYYSATNDPRYISFRYEQVEN